MSIPATALANSLPNSVLDTFDFLRKNTKEGASILEVGCGKGELAQLLQESGYKVQAVEKNPEHASLARARKIEVASIDFQNYSSPERFDCVAFTRSLHHFESMDTALQKAKDLLLPGGVLILDEFGADLIDDQAASWLFYLQQTFNATKMLTHLGGFGHEVKEGESALSLWKKHHFGHHKIWDSKSIRNSVHSHFVVEQEFRVAYLYRYIVENMASPELAVAVGEPLRQWELQIYQYMAAEPIGLRIVARKS